MSSQVIPQTPRSRVLSVGVVIPTTGRSRLTAAVKSALTQSHLADEVLVVVDGPLELIAGIPLPENDRLRVISALPLSGKSATRNAGIRHLNTNLVAMLDDDDEWLPTKLELQIHAWEEASRLGVKYPVIGCRAIIQDWPGRTRGIQPKEVIQPGQRIGDFFFHRRYVLPGHGLLIPSMLLCDSELARLTPFDESLRRHEDQDWLLRVGARGDTSLIQLTEPLIRYTEDAKGASHQPGWEDSFAWVMERGGLLTPGEQADCLLCHTAQRALVNGDLKGFLVVVRRVKRMGGASRKAWLWITAGVFAYALVDHLASAVRRVRAAIGGAISTNSQLRPLGRPAPRRPRT